VSRPIIKFFFLTSILRPVVSVCALVRLLCPLRFKLSGIFSFPLPPTTVHRLSTNGCQPNPPLYFPNSKCCCVRRVLDKFLAIFLSRPATFRSERKRNMTMLLQEKCHNPIHHIATNLQKHERTSRRSAKSRTLRAASPTYYLAD